MPIFEKLPVFQIHLLEGIITNDKSIPSSQTKVSAGETQRSKE